VWPSSVSLEHLSDGPDEAHIPVLPEAEPGNDVGWDPEVTVNTFRDFPYDYATLGASLLPSVAALTLLFIGLAA
jgi:hypothetical protein